MTESSFPVVVIGCSWGGLGALSAILDGIPDELPAAVVVAQHRPHRPSELSSLLRNHTSWPVCEADDKERLSPKRVYLAPPGYHLLVDGDHFALSTEAPVRNSRPSVDVLFESAAEAFGPRVIGVVLTGANDDGAAGLTEIVRHGGAAVIQHPATAERANMPRAAIATGVDATVVPLAELGAAITRLVHERAPEASDSPA
jgi:two-component system chemotaxis response regulator CheB